MQLNLLDWTVPAPVRMPTVTRAWTDREMDVLIEAYHSGDMPDIAAIAARRPHLQHGRAPSEPARPLVHPARRAVEDARLHPPVRPQLLVASCSPTASARPASAAENTWSAAHDRYQSGRPDAAPTSTRTRAST